MLQSTLVLPADVYNGMIPTILRDLPRGTSETVHFIAFTPEHRIIQLEITPAGTQKMMVGDVAVMAVHHVLKARLGIYGLMPSPSFSDTLPKMPTHGSLMEAYQR